MIRALLVISLTFAFVLLAGPPLLLYSFLRADTDALYRTGVRGARLALWLAGIRLDVKGRGKIPRDGSVVFMSNHQGNIDPPAIFVLLPPVLIVAKEEFFRVPVLGRAMRMRGFIPVDRKNREKAIAAMEQAYLRLKEGHSFLVFPEGTRSRDGRLQPFKKGVFLLALRAGVPILPITISGSSRVMQKGKFAIHPGTVRVTFHDPVPTLGLTQDDRDLVSNQVRAAIIAGLSEKELPLESPSDQPLAS
jgi:1-acyl-sn-glycerol-3-phosphate acyltransferase